MDDRLEILRWQFSLVWRLAQHHIPKLTDEACLFEPAPGSWSVRRRADGTWHPDWADRQPDPPPPVTIGWLTWQILWWWSSLTEAVADGRIPSREEVLWPGTARDTIEELQSLSARWTDILAGLEPSDLDRLVSYPWKEKRRLAIALAWANSELMKNIAEIGVLRHLFIARGGVAGQIRECVADARASGIAPPVIRLNPRSTNR